MSRVLALAIICGLALTTGTEASHRRRAASQMKQASPNQPVQVQDEYKSCDVAVRDFVQGRKEATALPVKEVKVDGLRMTLNFIHSYGESGDTPPNLTVTHIFLLWVKDFISLADLAALGGRARERTCLMKPVVGPRPSSRRLTLGMPDAPTVS